MPLFYQGQTWFKLVVVRSFMPGTPNSGLGDRTLVSTADVEIENANQLSRVYWNSLDAFFGQSCNLILGANGCTSIYLDTPNLDLLKAGLSLRDRPGGRSSCGEQYPDQFGLKYRHTEFQEAATRIVGALFPVR